MRGGMRSFLRCSAALQKVLISPIPATLEDKPINLARGKGKKYKKKRFGVDKLTPLLPATEILRGKHPIYPQWPAPSSRKVDDSESAAPMAQAYDNGDFPMWWNDSGDPLSPDGSYFGNLPQHANTLQGKPSQVKPLDPADVPIPVMRLGISKPIVGKRAMEAIADSRVLHSFHSADISVEGVVFATRVVAVVQSYNEEFACGVLGDPSDNPDRQETLPWPPVFFDGGEVLRAEEFESASPSHAAADAEDSHSATQRSPSHAAEDTEDSHSATQRDASRSVQRPKSGLLVGALVQCDLLAVTTREPWRWELAGFPDSTVQRSYDSGPVWAACLLPSQLRDRVSLAGKSNFYAINVRILPVKAPPQYPQHRADVRRSSLCGAGRL